MTPADDINLHFTRDIHRLDASDRSLRTIQQGDGADTPAGFNITAASEMMVILCLAGSRDDLERRLGNIVVGNQA